MKKKTPAKKQPETYEEHVVAAWESFQNHAKYNVIPPASYLFFEGEEVFLGNIKDCIVEKVLDSGRILQIGYHDCGRVNHTDYDNGRRPRFAWWTDIEPKSLVEDTHFAGTPAYLRASYISTSLDGIIHRVYFRGLIDSPEYQRDYVWTDQDRENLIDSIMNGFDIGKFVLLTREYPETRDEVIDGKQRLNTIMSFIQNKFAYKGKTWYQFSRHDKQQFESLNVQYAELQDAKCKKSDVLWMFLSINAGGVPQTEEHVSGVRKMYEQALKEGN